MKHFTGKGLTGLKSRTFIYDQQNAPYFVTRCFVLNKDLKKGTHKYPFFFLNNLLT